MKFDEIFTKNNSKNGQIASKLRKNEDLPIDIRFETDLKHKNTKKSRKTQENIPKYPDIV